MTPAEALQDIRDRIAVHNENVRLCGDELDHLAVANDTIEDIEYVLDLVNDEEFDT